MKKITRGQKNRIIFLAVVLCVILSGCGSSVDSSTAMEGSAPAADDSTMADFYAEQLENQSEEAETWAKAPSDTDVIEEPVTEPTLEEVIAEVLKYAESENMVIVDRDNINDLIEIMYIAESSDALTIYKLLCDDGHIISAPIVPEGIIVLSYSGPQVMMEEARREGGTTINLDCIDSDTGVVRHLRTFYYEDISRCFPAFNGLSANVTLSLMHFNSDLTKMTAQATLEDGSVHVGWIDESGDFTDVSAKVVTDVGDFGALTNHSNPCFGPGGYFYFRDSTNTNVQDKRVPLDNLTASAVEVLTDYVEYLGLPLYPFPDGTVEDTIWDKNYYYDESMEYPAKGNFFDDWISPFECVGIADNKIYKYTLSGEDSGLHDWYSERTELVPDIKGRTNWTPVVSPDGTEIAFLSALTTGTDTSPYLYIVSADGGNPVKVPTDYTFYETPVYTNYSGGGFYATFLLTWE